jgi:cell division protein FtsB
MQRLAPFRHLNMIDSKYNILISICIIALFAMLLFSLFSDKGLSDYFELKSERDRLVIENIQLKEKNDELYRTIERLRNDPEYIESVARKELGMIKEDEVILTPGKTTDTAE